MQRFINNWAGTLIQDLLVTDNIINIKESGANHLSGNIKKNDYYFLTLDDGEKIEIVKAIAVQGNQLQVQRGQENTMANHWSRGSKIEARITAQTLENLQSMADRILTAKGEILVSSNGNVLIY